MAKDQLENLIIHTACAADIFRLEFIIAGMNGAKEHGYFQRQFKRQEDDGSRQVYIAVIDGVDAGYCILNWTPKYSFFKKLDIPEVQDLNVIPQFRRQGIATAMIEYCEDLARDQRKDYMGIGVAVGPQSGPAQRLYGSLGYVADGNGVTYDRKLTAPHEVRPLDDQLCLMMVKGL